MCWVFCWILQTVPQKKKTQLKTSQAESGLISNHFAQVLRKIPWNHDPELALMVPGSRDRTNWKPFTKSARSPAVQSISCIGQNNAQLESGWSSRQVICCDLQAQIRMKIGMHVRFTRSLQVMEIIKQHLNTIFRARVPEPYCSAPGPFKTGRGRAYMHLGCLLDRICMWKCVK